MKKHAALKWKDAISGFPVSQGSAEALVRWGGKIKYILIACFLRNICAKNCCNRIVYVNIVASQSWDVFFETQCRNIFKTKMTMRPRIKDVVNWFTIKLVYCVEILLKCLWMIYITYNIFKYFLDGWNAKNDEQWDSCCVLACRWNIGDLLQQTQHPVPQRYWLGDNNGISGTAQCFRTTHFAQNCTLKPLCNGNSEFLSLHPGVYQAWYVHGCKVYFQTMFSPWQVYNLVRNNYDLASERRLSRHWKGPPYYLLV